MSANRPWTAIYPEGAPTEINPDIYSSLVDMYEEVFRKYHSRPAFLYMGKSITYGQLDQQTRQLAAYFASIGLEAGDRIALMMPNMMQYPIALFGALRAGLVVVNTNPLYTPREMHHQFKDSGAKAIIIAENFAQNLQKIIGETDIKHVIVTSAGEMLGFPKGNIVNYVVRNVKKMVPPYQLANTITFSKALSAGKNLPFSPRKTGSDDVVLLQYTGGTTGLSKGAMLTNRNLIANVLQFNAIGGKMLDEV